MNKTLLYIGAAIVATSVLGACDDDFTRPPVVLPPTVQVEPTTTIADFKPDYWNTITSGPTTIGYGALGDTVIFIGRVCSSDATGNIYKSLIIQGRNEQGEQVALNFSVNSYDIYELFPFGQEVAVYASGLSIGGYHGLLQFGAANGSEMTFMDATLFQEHVVRTGVGLPEPAKVDTTATTVAELMEVKDDAEQLMLWQSRLVRVENVEFEDAGETFAGSQTSNRYVKDENGNRLNVRNSSYADFRNEILPYGKGNVTGILSYYNTDWQILLIDADGCAGFDGTAPEPGTGTEPGEAVTSVSENFDASTNIPDGWTTVKTAGDKDWYVREFNGNNYANVTGYNGTAPFDAWLITPALDIDNAAEKVMSFRSQVNGYGSTTSTFKVFVLSSADPSTATLTELHPTLPEAPESGYSSWIESGELSLAEFTGIIYIGFRFEATQDANYATWCIDDVLAGVKGTGGETPNPPAEGELYSLLPGSAAELPSDWTIENVETGGLSEIWSWKVFNSVGYLNGSAFVSGGAVATEAYAVSPVLDLTGATGCTATFEHTAKFQTTLRTLCGVVVREEGTTEWTNLTIPVWPEAGNWTFVSSGNVDLSAYDGKKIQIGFKYGSSSDGADTWEIRNLIINGNK